MKFTHLTYNPLNIELFRKKKIPSDPDCVDYLVFESEERRER